MRTSEALLIVCVVAAVTYAFRAGGIVLLADRGLPAPVARAMRHVGPAVLAALVASIAAVGPDGSTGVGVAEVAALAATAIVARWRSNLLVGLVAGMVTLWLCMAVI